MCADPRVPGDLLWKVHVKGMEVQGRASEGVLPEDRKQKVGLEGSVLREEGDQWLAGVNPWTWKRSSEPEGLRTQAEGEGRVVFTFS